MSVSHNNTSVITDDLVLYIDVNNPKCVDASADITSSTKLKNLAGGSYSDIQLGVYDSGAVPEMQFIKHEQTGLWIYDQDGVSDTGEAPGWISDANYDRTDDDNNFTFICWYKYPHGNSTQRAQNIYGGGFQSKTSFYLSPGGTSSSRGVLRYPNSGTSGAGNFSSTTFSSKEQWICFAATDRNVPSGTYETKRYFNGVLIGTNTASASFVAPTGNNKFTWGSWSGSYGAATMEANLFMYYNRVLTDEEIMHNYLATREKFGSLHDLDN
jgi:hypothetical protein|tara:strand:- start:175 stop:981 length:807 start_codon:yes stop_codon:yes gene_type:complete